MSITQKQSDLPDKAEPTRLSHVAFCALVALALERQSGRINTPFAENLFLVRWLATAQKQKRFPKSVAVDIAWLLAFGRQQGANGKLRQHLEKFWASYSGHLADKSDLHRLAYAIERLKDRGWENYVMDAQEWASEVIERPPDGGNVIFVCKPSLNDSYSAEGQQLHPVVLRVVGAVATLLEELAAYHLSAHQTPGSLTPFTVTLHPAATT